MKKKYYIFFSIAIVFLIVSIVLISVTRGGRKMSPINQLNLYDNVSSTILDFVDNLSQKNFLALSPMLSGEVKNDLERYKAGLDDENIKYDYSGNFFHQVYENMVEINVVSISQISNEEDNQNILVDVVYTLKTLEANESYYEGFNQVISYFKLVFEGNRWTISQINIEDIEQITLPKILNIDNIAVDDIKKIELTNIDGATLGSTDKEDIQKFIDIILETQVDTERSNLTSLEPKYSVKLQMKTADSEDVLVSIPDRYVVITQNHEVHFSVVDQQAFYKRMLDLFSSMQPVNSAEMITQSHLTLSRLNKANVSTITVSNMYRTFAVETSRYVVESENFSKVLSWLSGIKLSYYVIQTPPLLEEDWLNVDVVLTDGSKVTVTTNYKFVVINGVAFKADERKLQMPK